MKNREEFAASGPDSDIHQPSLMSASACNLLEEAHAGICWGVGKGIGRIIFFPSVDHLILVYQGFLVWLLG